MNSNYIPPRILLLLSALIFVWGCSFPILKIGLREIPPLTFRASVVPFGILVLSVLALISRHSSILPRGQWRTLMLTSVFNVTGWFVLSAYGLSLLGSGHAIIIAYTMPLWASLFSMIFIGEEATVRRIAGLCFGLAGMAVLLSGKFGMINFSPMGLVCMFGAAISWGIGTVLQKRTTWNIHSLLVAQWQFVIGGLPIAVAALLFEVPDLQPVSWKAIAVVVYTLLFPLLFCWFAWFKIVSILPVTVASVSTMIIPVIGVITSNLILGEAIGKYEIGALCLVCTGLAFVLIPPGSKRKAN
ncbi:MAG: DMT family transporter [SAR324 cluster bacterium]|nr:DMT family transporter [SAR324 cluster bacterium]